MRWSDLPVKETNFKNILMACTNLSTTNTILEWFGRIHSWLRLWREQAIWTNDMVRRDIMIWRYFS